MDIPTVTTECIENEIVNMGLVMMFQQVALIEPFYFSRRCEKALFSVSNHESPNSDG